MDPLLEASPGPWVLTTPDSPMQTLWVWERTWGYRGVMERVSLNQPHGKGGPQGPDLGEGLPHLLKAQISLPLGAV